MSVVLSYSIHDLSLSCHISLLQLATIQQSARGSYYNTVFK